MKCSIVRDANGDMKLRWRCPLCSYKWDLVQADGEIFCFLAVHHLAKKHGMDKVEILLFRPILRAAADEYFACFLGVELVGHAGTPLS